MVNIPLFTRFYTSQVVVGDFFHQPLPFGCTFAVQEFFGLNPAQDTQLHLEMFFECNCSHGVYIVNISIMKGESLVAVC